MSTLNSLIDTIYHGLTCSNEPVNQPDMAHYDSMSELKLGYLFIEELIKFFKNKKEQIKFALFVYYLFLI